AAAGPEAFDVVAGGETAGIPFAAWVAEAMGLPMAYVRKKPKGFGRNALIEGVVNAGDRVLLVEDLVTDGGSKIHFIDALRAVDATVAHIAVVFRYGVFPEGEATLADMGCALHGLTSWPELLAFAEDDGRIPSSAAAEARRFLDDPDAWSAQRAG
ncbi:MAG: phosphoribosyltransferase family protein, partial [Pseudomonadota bacterium]